MNNKCCKYDNLCDALEYGNISEHEAISICNSIIAESTSETEPAVLESMFHAIFTAIVNRKIGKELNTDSIINNIETYSEEVSDYIITILAYSGKREYEIIIKHLGEKFPDLDINEALTELYSRSQS